MSIHSRTAAPGSGSVSGSGSIGQPRSHPLSSVSFSPGYGDYAVASGKNLLHIFRLHPDPDKGKGYSHRLEELKSIRVSQVRDSWYFSSHMTSCDA
jgi:hypothetical protein